MFVILFAILTGILLLLKVTWYYFENRYREKKQKLKEMERKLNPPDSKPPTNPPGNGNG